MCIHTQNAQTKKQTPSLWYPGCPWIYTTPHDRHVFKIHNHNHNHNHTTPPLHHRYLNHTPHYDIQTPTTRSGSPPDRCVIHKSLSRTPEATDRPTDRPIDRPIDQSRPGNRPPRAKMWLSCVVVDVGAVPESSIPRVMARANGTSAHLTPTDEQCRRKR